MIEFKVRRPKDRSFVRLVLTAVSAGTRLVNTKTNIFLNERHMAACIQEIRPARMFASKTRIVETLQKGRIGENIDAVFDVLRRSARTAATAGVTTPHPAAVHTSSGPGQFPEQEGLRQAVGNLAELNPLISRHRPI